MQGGLLNDNSMAMLQQMLMRQQQMDEQAQQQQSRNPLGILAQLAPMLMNKGPILGQNTSAMGSGGPLTVPAGSQINQMAPEIRGQLPGDGRGAGILGLLKGLF